MAEETPTGAFYGSVPVFRVDDVLVTAAYYRDVLGFEIDFVYGEPPSYASVSRDDAVLNFTHARAPDWRDGGMGVDAMIVVADAHAVFHELGERGAHHPAAGRPADRHERLRYRGLQQSTAWRSQSRRRANET